MTLTAPVQHPPAAPVQVVMPAGLLPRLPQMLAVLGLKLYRIPTKDEPTLLIAADLQQLGGGASLQSAGDVTDAWDLAVAILSKPAAEKPVKRRRSKKPAA